MADESIASASVLAVIPFLLFLPLTVVEIIGRSFLLVAVDLLHLL
jgi:hypothetical protein